MKTMLVVSSKRVNAHIGEEYDVISEVTHDPTTENIQPYADKIMREIRELWIQDGGDDKRIVVSLDAAIPFAAMLVNLKIIMKTQDGIVLELPWEKPQDLSELDAESKDVLSKLERK